MIVSRKIAKNQVFSRGLALGLAAWVLALIILPSFAEVADEGGRDIDLFEKERQIKNEEELKIQKNILDPILGAGRAVVFVDVELAIETQRLQQKGQAEEKKSQQKGSLTQKETEFILPGLPNPKSVTAKPEKPAAAKEEEQSQKLTKEKIISKTIVRNFGVTVIHDERIIPEKIKIVKERILSAMVKYKLTEKQLVFKPTKFTALTWEQLIDANRIIPLITAFLLLLLLLFLFGPLRAFFKGYLRTIQDKAGAEVNIESKLEGPEGGEGEDKEVTGDVEGGGGGGGGGYLDDHPDYKPFSYITEENIVKLAYLIRKEPPDIISIVVNYLQPEFVRTILAKLSPEVQAKVAVYMATIRQMSFEQVLAIDKDIKGRIDYLVGSLDSLLKLLDIVDKVTQENILEYLKNEKPHLYQKVRESLLTFDDIPNFDNQTLQLVIRELRPDSLARALKTASASVMNRFFENMTSGAAALLKEEMEYGRPMTEDEVEAEKDAILEVVKKMEIQGKISIRKERPKDVLEGEEDVSVNFHQISLDSPKAQDAHPVDPQLPTYFASAVELYNQGRLEEAMAYFRYVAQLDPGQWQAHQYLGACYQSMGLWQEALAAYEEVLKYQPSPELQAWVENFKASLQSTPTQGEAA